MEKRTVIALALSFLILGFYPVILQKFYPGYKSSYQHASSAVAPSKISPSKEIVISRAEEFLLSEDVEFKNEKLKLLFNQKNGVIREISFPDFMNSETKKPLEFLSLKDSKAAPTSVVLLGGNGPAPQTKYTFQVAGNQVVSASEISEGKIKITKNYSFHDSGYSADLGIMFENITDTPVDLRYELFVGSRIPPRHSIDTQYIEANFFSKTGEKSSLRHIKETRLGKEVQSQSAVQWVALKDRHFSIILKPKSEMPFTGLARGLGERHLSASLISTPVTIPAHGSIRQDFLLYMGPNELKELLPLGLEDLVNFGKLDMIGKLLVGGLEILNKILNNYGLSIILLTALINLLLFPLTRVSYMSMKRMQLIQPQMNKLREQHKKNPDKLNKEMMELYRKHKVNPFGGCLPMLVQMPIFIALYVALSKSVILINSKLFWIQDLSSPDSMNLPFSLPFFGNAVHVLPLLMVAAMFFQQKLTQINIEGQDPALAQQQKMMAVMMPVIFGFIFYAMPSGLVLYWLTNTLLMTFYQLRLKKITLT